MTINGVNYRLTKHGRARFIERCRFAPDAEIIAECVSNPKAVWAEDKNSDGFRLVTFL